MAFAPLPTPSLPPASPPLAVVITPLPLQTAPSALAHAIHVEGANIHNHVRVHLDMKGANYSVWRDLMLETIDQYDVADHICPDFNNHASDTAWKIINKAVKNGSTGP